MADELQIRLTARDELNGKLKDTTATVKRLQGELVQLAKEIDKPGNQRKYDETRRALSEVSLEQKRVRAEIGRNERALKSMGDEGKRSMEKVGRSTDTLRTKLRGVGTAIKSSGLTKWAAGGVFALGGLATAAGMIGIKAAASMEQSEVAFESLLGSKGKAKKLLDELSKMAAETPFEFPQLVDASQQLLAYGFKAGQITPMLTSIGDAAAATGKGAEGVDRITRALGQMQAKGKISNEELMQIGELGIPVYDIMAEKLGIAKSEVSAFLAAPARTDKNGRRTAGGAEDAFASLGGVEGLLDGIGKKYDGMMGKQSKTLAGLWSTLKDTFGMGLVKLIMPYMDGIKSGATAAIDGLGGAFKRVGTIIEQVRPTVVTVFKFVRDNKDYFIAAAAAIGAMTIAVGLLSLAMSINPVTLFIGAIALLAVWYTFLYKKVGWFRAFVQKSWIIIKAGAKAFVAWFKETAVPALTRAWTKIREVAAKFVTWFATVAWPKIKWAAGYIIGYYKTLWSVAKVVWSGVKVAVSLFVAYFKNVAWPAIRTAGKAIGAMFRTAWNIAKEVWPKVSDAIGKVRDVVVILREKLTGLWDGVASGAQRAADAVKSAWNGVKDIADKLNPFGGGDDGRWMGGPVSAGWRGWVGELGPELFVPNIGEPRMVGEGGPEVRGFSQSGYVIPAHLTPQVSGVLRERERVLVGSGGPTIQTGDIYATSNVDVEAALIHAEMRRSRIANERRAGGRR